MYMMEGMYTKTRNNIVDHIWFQIKQHIMKEWSRDVVFIFEIIYVNRYTCIII